MNFRVAIAVEGLADEAVARRLLEHVGAVPDCIRSHGGKANLKKKSLSYNRAARHAAWLLLVDLDRDANCAPRLRQAWLPQPAPLMCFRVAVRAVEAWLLADAEAMAAFLGVALAKVPRDPEKLPNPKSALVSLARGSPYRAMREEMVPRPGSGREEGPAYALRVVEYAQKHWRPKVAARHADSLARAIRCLRRLACGCCLPETDP